MERIYDYLIEKISNSLIKYASKGDGLFLNKEEYKSIAGKVREKVEHEGF